VKRGLRKPLAAAARALGNSLFPDPRLPQGVASVVDEKSVAGHSVYAMVLQALILDYGNVLSQPQDEHWFEVMAAEIGTSRDPFRVAYWRHRPLYDAGLPAREYWGRVLDTLGAEGQGQNDGRVIDRLIDADVAPGPGTGRMCGY
jgi:hypothetical protein